MKKIMDGIYRAKRMDGSGYVYGFYRTKGNFPNAPEGCFIKVSETSTWITPVHRDTLRYRINGKWEKVE